MTVRRLSSTSTYVDAFEASRTFDLDVPDDADDDALGDLLQPESGAGHFAPDGGPVDAYYEIRSIDGLTPEIHWEATG